MRAWSVFGLRSAIDGRAAAISRGRLLGRGRGGAQGDGDLAQQFIPVGAAVLRDGEPSVDVEHIGHVLDGE